MEGVISELRRSAIEVKLRSYARLLDQGSRQHQSPLSLLPKDILLKIAAKAAAIADASAWSESYEGSDIALARKFLARPS
jgi:hypothetical protein